MFKRKQSALYIFRGFLDSGKTTFLMETMKEGQFEDKKTTLLILCEEGECEIPEELLKKNKFTVKTIDDEEDVSEELFKVWDKELKPDRVMIESNGMWDVNEILDAVPDTWELIEEITTVDSTSFESYLANMKMMMTNHFVDADLVVFNRCREDHDRAMFKRMVRAVNKRAQVLFETPEGEVDNDAHEEPPYDLNADIIEVQDDDFGIFYLDAIDNIESFKGKTVKFKGMYYKPKNSAPDVFVPGRRAMNCCADDITFLGFPCKSDKTAEYANKDWIMVTAKVGSAPAKDAPGGEAPVLYALEIEKASEPEEEIVYFN